MKRPSGRQYNQLREIKVDTHISKHAAGSCLISFGDTQVLCSASIDESIPPFLKGKKQGWVTAEYSMLPGSSHPRIRREVQSGKQSGRTHEIQRLIARSLRSIVNLSLLGERQIIVDCDVIQADGGTRTASITGGYIALHLACQKLLKSNQISRMPLTGSVAGISCGIYKGHAVLDLDYAEDSNAEVDANFVITNTNKLVEVQSTAEKDPFTEEQLIQMLELAKLAALQLTDIQKQNLEI